MAEVPQAGLGAVPVGLTRRAFGVEGVTEPAAAPVAGLAVALAAGPVA